MKYTRLIGTVIAFCMAVPLFAQQYKATIPYRMVGEKMVIEMKVNALLSLIPEGAPHLPLKPVKHYK
jgi:hypothetical protein